MGRIFQQLTTQYGQVLHTNVVVLFDLMQSFLELCQRTRMNTRKHAVRYDMIRWTILMCAQKLTS